jgi:folate-binding protein YgfZ
MSITLPYYREASESAVAFDLSSFGKMSLTGKDRSAFLQNFTTNDVVKPGIGSGCETFLTTAQARIVAWLRVANRQDDVYLNMEPGLAAGVLAHLEKFVIGEDVQFEDRTDKDFLWLISGKTVGSGHATLPPVEQMKLWDCQSGVWGSTTLQRCDFLGQPAAFLWGPREQEDQARSQIGSIPMVSLNEPVWTTLRLEAGTPAYGIDIDETYLPQEVNRTDQAISFTKGCYIGQETVARIRAYGHVNRQLLRLTLEGNPSQPANWQGASLMAKDKEVGKLKSVAWSPKWNSLLAFGLVRKEHVAPGTELLVAQGEERCGAKVLGT